MVKAMTEEQVGRLLADQGPDGINVFNNLFIMFGASGGNVTCCVSSPPTATFGAFCASAILKLANQWGVHAHHICIGPGGIMNNPPADTSMSEVCELYGDPVMGTIPMLYI